MRSNSRTGKNRHPLSWITICCTFLLFCCCKDDDLDPGDLTGIVYSPTEYELNVPKGFPAVEVPADNPLTEEGVELGRMLFFDPILSVDSTISCASCHLASLSFTDGLNVSEGINGLTGTRSAMSLINVAYHFDGMFWDGRSATLEDQALEPVVNPLEMGDNWEEIELKLMKHETYPEFFRKAFGISNVTQIDRTYVAKALASFERIMISSGNSKYDRYLRGEIFPTDDELNGFEMFFDTTTDLPDAECGHCHTGIMMTTNEYLNNGLDDVESLDDYPDKGRGDFTGNRFDNGKFKVPTLRNIALTAPYMHDGRFATLEEVLDHYNSGGHHISDPDEDNVSNFIHPLGLSEKEKSQVISFLHMLTDTSFTQNEEINNPFK